MSRPHDPHAHDGHGHAGQAHGDHDHDHDDHVEAAHGTMRGTFFCMTEDAHAFDAPIEPFTLARAGALH